MDQRTHRTDEEIVVGHHGGRQSKINYAPRLIPGEALCVLEPYFDEDVTTGKMPWRDEDIRIHANNAMRSFNQLLQTSDIKHLYDAFAFLAKAVSNEDKKENCAPQPCNIPAEAILRLAEIVHIGEQRYTANNWRLLPFTDEIDHAMTHLYQWFAGDMSDDHLGHSFTRTSFAIATVPPDGFDFKAISKDHPTQKGIDALDEPLG